MPEPITIPVNAEDVEDDEDEPLFESEKSGNGEEYADDKPLFDSPYRGSVEEKKSYAEAPPARPDQRLKNKINEFLNTPGKERGVPPPDDVSPYIAEIDLFKFALREGLHDEEARVIYEKFEEAEREQLGIKYSLRYQHSVPRAPSLIFQDLDYPELKEIFSVPSNLSGKIQVGDMMEVTAKTPKSSSANIYKGKLDGHEKAIYLPAWMFNKDNQSKEKNNQYSLRRTPKKWTKNKFRKGKHSIKKGVHRVRRKIGIGGGSQRRRRSKLTRGKYKTKKKHKTRKRIKSRRF